METNNAGGNFTAKTINEKERLEKIKKLAPDATLPYEDPAIVNPEELASFPKPAPKLEAHEIDEENDNTMVNLKRSPVREGRNIVRTDTAPDPDGFL